MRDNVEALSSLNAGFASEWDGLRNVPLTTALEARSLGYLARDEVAIRLSLAADAPNPPSPGTLVAYEAGQALSERMMKELAGIAALFTAILGLAMKAAKPRADRAKRAFQREILVQEASRT
ncbi:MAG: hypothetical protein KKA67_13625 [Spirochaetes bacterium]|nr:hypothetical protein [Spirochaetota bacterium]MBU1079300.1 hypothetical protein [Spirochaetota bacterium]